jgi:cupin superfamily acireductone dioxygenase involved in methionine salvage
MKNYIIILIILTVIGFIHTTENNEQLSTFKLADNLYIETHQAGIAGHLRTEFLTDSAHFKIHIGTFNDENGYFAFKVNGDKVYIEKREYLITPDRRQHGIKITQQKQFSLKELKSKHTPD